MATDPYSAEITAVTEAVHRLRTLVESVTDWTPTRVTVFYRGADVMAEWLRSDPEAKVAHLFADGLVMPLGLNVGTGHDDEIRAWFARIKREVTGG